MCIENVHVRTHAYFGICVHMFFRASQTPYGEMEEDDDVS